MVTKVKFIQVILLILITGFVYLPILWGFFQQDEWFSYGFYIAHSDLSLSDLLRYYFAPDIGHYNPLTNLVQHGLFKVFGMNFFVFAGIGIVLHLLVVLAVYFFLRKVFKDHGMISFMLALLFGVLGAQFQAVSWVVADISTLTASFFGVVAMCVFWEFLDNKKHSYLLLSLFLVVVSLMFKEITIGLFPLFFLVLLIKTFRSVHLKEFGQILLISITGASYAFFRLAMIFIPVAGVERSLVTDSQPLGNIILNFLVIPISTISQIIIPFNKLSLILGIIFIVLGFVAYSRSRGDRYRGLVLFAIAWVIFNSFIFAFSPEKVGIQFAVDSRNLYFSAIGGVIYLGSMVYLIFKNQKSRLLIVLISLFIFNILWLERNLYLLTMLGGERREILETIKENHASLPKKVVFFAQSTDGYFGLSETEMIMPFQSGFGRTLLTWYWDSEKFPISFFSSKFLWGIKDQGYQEVGERGFGYFRHFSDLAKFYENSGLSYKETLIAYIYDSQERVLKENSEEMVGRLNGYFVTKKLMDRSKFSLSATLNKQKIHLAVDGRRDTKWNSGKPAVFDQAIEILIPEKARVAGIRIDSGDDLNQDKVGYRLVVTKRRGESEETVFEAKRYSPDKDGIVEIYFEPMIVEKIRIEQIGTHQYANWVVAELGIYETSN